MKFKDIKKIARSYYNVNVSWKYMHESLDGYKDHYNLELQPDFQRAHVWTVEQQIKYVEWILRGGESGRNLLFNCPNWMGAGETGEMVLVDGLQRLTAAQLFMGNSLPIFPDMNNLKGYYLRDFEDKFPWSDADFVFYVNNLKTREEVLQWYIDINSGGTVHTTNEIAKVKELLIEEQK